MHKHLHVLPDQFLGAFVSKQIGGMIGHDHACLTVLVESPRRLPTGRVRPSSDRTATAPRHTMYLGCKTSSCASTKGCSFSISSGTGVRFWGGRHFSALRMKTSSRLSCMASMILVSSCPARPTKVFPTCLRLRRGFAHETNGWGVWGQSRRRSVGDSTRCRYTNDRL